MTADQALEAVQVGIGLTGPLPVRFEHHRIFMADETPDAAGQCDGLLDIGGRRAVAGYVNGKRVTLLLTSGPSGLDEQESWV